jgi:hypothetical protein
MNLVRYRVKLLQNPTGINTPHPISATHCLYILYFDTGEGGRGERVEPERRLEGHQFTKLGRKYQHD